MCGRFTLTIPAEVLREVFGLGSVPALSPRSNIAPTEEVAIVRNGRSPGSERVLVGAVWGVPVPSRRGADRPRRGPLINARQETAFEKPLLRAAARFRRCLVPADGFYEWKKEERGRRQPFRLHLKGDHAFAIAGLFEPAPSPEDASREACVLLTTPANELVASIHDRMPVILTDDAFRLWLDPTVLDRDALEHLLRPFEAARMVADPIAEVPSVHPHPQLGFVFHR